MTRWSALKARLTAGAVHAAASAAVVCVVLALTLLVWYPAPLDVCQGVTKILLVLVVVQLVIGPIITLVVYDRSKRSLKFDLAVVILLQIAALAYGLHTILVARPAYLVFAIDRFEVVSAQDVDRDSLARARAAGHSGLSLRGPRVVHARLPDASAQRNALLFSAVRGGPDLSQLPEWYRPYESGRESVLDRLRPLDELRVANRLDDRGWTDFLETLDSPPARMGYLPLKGRVRDGVVIVNRDTAEVQRIMLLEPQW
jgi:hypothetical protein